MFGKVLIVVSRAGQLCLQLGARVFSAGAFVVYASVRLRNFHLYPRSPEAEGDD